MNWWDRRWLYKSRKPWYLTAIDDDPQGFPFTPLGCFAALVGAISFIFMIGAFTIGGKDLIGGIFLIVGCICAIVFTLFGIEEADGPD